VSPRRLIVSVYVDLSSSIPVQYRSTEDKELDRDLTYMTGSSCSVGSTSRLLLLLFFLTYAVCSSRTFFPLICSRHVHVIACPPPDIVYPCCSSSHRKTFSFIPPSVVARTTLSLFLFQWEYLESFRHSRGLCVINLNPRIDEYQVRFPMLETPINHQ